MKLLKAIKDWLTDPITLKSFLIFATLVLVSSAWLFIKDIEDFTQNFWKHFVMILVVAFIGAIYAYWVEKKRQRNKA